MIRRNRDSYAIGASALGDPVVSFRPFTVPLAERSAEQGDAAHRSLWSSRSSIALRAREEAAPTWHKHGLRRAEAVPQPGFEGATNAADQVNEQTAYVDLFVSTDRSRHRAEATTPDLLIRLQLSVFEVDCTATCASACA